METAKAFIASGMLLFIGWMIFLILFFLTAWIRKRAVSPLVIFKDFRQKIWMTSGLGCAFFSFYAACLYAGSLFTDPENRLALFFLMYRDPIFFIYLGLLLFACTSISIYLVRLLIKYLCNKRRFF